MCFFRTKTMEKSVHQNFYRVHFRRWVGISTAWCSWLRTYVTRVFTVIYRQLDNVREKVAPPIPIEKHRTFRFRYSILSQHIGKWSKSCRFVRDHAKFGIKNDLLDTWNSKDLPHFVMVSIRPLRLFERSPGIIYTITGVSKLLKI